MGNMKKKKENAGLIDLYTFHFVQSENQKVISVHVSHCNT